MTIEHFGTSCLKFWEFGLFLQDLGFLIPLVGLW